VTDRFRLIYLKSTEPEKDLSDHIRPVYEERGDQSFNPLKDVPSETQSIREILKQAKADLRHPDPKVRSLAVKFYLENSHLCIEMPLLQEILSDSDSGIRAEALSILIAFGNSIISPFLKKYLKDPDPRVRMVALRGMFHLKEKLDLNLLMHLLSDDSPWVRRKLATLLGWNPIEGGLPILVEMSKDKDSKVRKAALFSLVSLYPEEGENRLMEAMTDSDPDIRKWAKDLLNRMLERPVIHSFLAR